MTSTKTITSTERAKIVSDAIKERKALRAWERKGSDPETRPDTPAIDRIEELHSMPDKGRSSRRNKTERQPSEVDQHVRELFVNGVITHPATKTELASALGLPRSTAGNAVRRLVKTDEMIQASDKPLRFWLTAAGKPGAVPQSDKPARTRKVYSVKGSGKTVHAAHSRTIDGERTLVPLCPAKLAQPERVDDAVTCKRCVRALDETAAA